MKSLCGTLRYTGANLCLARPPFPPRLFQEENLRGIGLAGLPATSRSCLCGTAYAVLLGLAVVGRTPCFALRLKSGRSYWNARVCFARYTFLFCLSSRADVHLRASARCFACAKPDALRLSACGLPCFASLPASSPLSLTAFV